MDVILTCKISNSTIMTKKGIKTNYRDAGTGKYVKKQYAEKHPKTTVKESDKLKK